MRCALQPARRLSACNFCRQRSHSQFEESQLATEVYFDQLLHARPAMRATELCMTQMLRHARHRVDYSVARMRLHGPKERR
jgi:hypothetical protein